MAPRTREQQDEYNRKRREASAQAKAARQPKGRGAEKVSDHKPAKGARKASGKVGPDAKVVRVPADPVKVKVVGKGKAAAVVALKPPKAKSMGNLGKVPPIKQPMGNKFQARAEPMDPDPDHAFTPLKPAQTVVAPKPVFTGGGTKPPIVSVPNKPVVLHEDSDDEVVTTSPKLADKGKLPPNMGEGAPKQHTMARSYLREGKPGKGKLRNGTYQCTTAFTPEQMDQVKAGATFRGVSLAEFIRACVVEHLNSLPDPTSD